MNYTEEPGYPRVSAISTKPESKDLPNSSYSCMDHDSYEFTPRADDSFELISKKTKNMNTNYTKVSFAEIIKLFIYSF